MKTYRTIASARMAMAGHLRNSLKWLKVTRLELLENGARVDIANAVCESLTNIARAVDYDVEVKSVFAQHVVGESSIRGERIDRRLHLIIKVRFDVKVKDKVECLIITDQMVFNGRLVGASFFHNFVPQDAPVESSQLAADIVPYMYTHQIAWTIGQCVSEIQPGGEHCAVADAIERIRVYLCNAMTAVADKYAIVDKVVDEVNVEKFGDVVFVSAQVHYIAAHSHGRVTSFPIELAYCSFEMSH